MADQSEIPPKKRKTSSVEQRVTQPSFQSFEGFHVHKVIGENPRSKTAVIKGEIKGETAVVLLEKEPFDVKHVDKYLGEHTALKNTLLNDIYGTYEAFPPQAENGR